MGALRTDMKLYEQLLEWHRRHCNSMVPLFRGTEVKFYTSGQTKPEYFVYHCKRLEYGIRVFICARNREVFRVEFYLDGESMEIINIGNFRDISLKLDGGSTEINPVPREKIEAFKKVFTNRLKMSLGI